MAAFDDWLSNQGYRYIEGDDQSYWTGPDGRLRDNDLSALQQQYASQLLTDTGDINQALASAPTIKDPDSGGYVDTASLLQQGGYASIPNQATIDYFNSTYGTNFGSPEDYMNYLYGGGEVANTSEGQYWKTPNGIDKFVNQPLSYDPQNFEFGDLVLSGIIAGATAGLTGSLPGTESVFGGAAGAEGIAEGMYGAGEAVDAAFGPGAGLTAAEGTAAVDAAYGLSGGSTIWDAGVNGWDLMDNPVAGESTPVDYGPSYSEAVAEPVTPTSDYTVPASNTEYSMPPPMEPPGPPVDPNWYQPLAPSGLMEAPSLTDSIIDWAKQNPMLASTGVSVVGGLIRGAMTPSPEEQWREKAAAEAQAQKEILDHKRQFGQVRGINLDRLRPTGRVLRQTGQLPPGLINRTMVAK